ncbi:hypothetical protein SXCC_01355 [Gluconacetobacter sp. SXCC-1]|nr:hypothetical protein SXCC_01355 [Gluconacetobacter sp. SXCC-1]
MCNLNIECQARTRKMHLCPSGAWMPSRMHRRGAGSVKINGNTK